jgi:hypothetical protein
MADRPVAVVETAEFLSATARLITEAERAALVCVVACRPEAGDLIRDTGGARKLRWAVGGQGKRGGVRAVYYFHDGISPIVMFTVYAKNEKSGLSAREKMDLKATISAIKREIGKGRGR